jgi:hypothetical protein
MCWTCIESITVKGETPTLWFRIEQQGKAGEEAPKEIKLSLKIIFHTQQQKMGLPLSSFSNLLN